MTIHKNRISRESNRRSNTDDKRILHSRVDISLLIVLLAGINDRQESLSGAKKNRV